MLEAERIQTQPTWIYQLVREMAAKFKGRELKH
jgi:hypothetical protein